jgi:hypothetical protein
MKVGDGTLVLDVKPALDTKCDYVLTLEVSAPSALQYSYDAENRQLYISDQSEVGLWEVKLTTITDEPAIEPFIEIIYVEI